MGWEATVTRVFQLEHQIRHTNTSIYLLPYPIFSPTISIQLNSSYNMGFSRQEEPPNPSKRCKCLSATLKDAFSNCHGHHEESSDPSKRCKFLSSTLKDAFSDCHTFRGRLSSTTPEDDQLTSSDYDEEEVLTNDIIVCFFSLTNINYSSAERAGVLTFLYTFSPSPVRNSYERFCLFAGICVSYHK